MRRLYAIGDIHGQRDMLRAAHARVAADRRRCGDVDAPLVHLGDLTDRGPDSRGVIEDLVRGIAEGEPWHVIRGNHDQLFLDFLSFEGEDDPRRDTALYWLRPNLGGSATMASYGVDPDPRRDLEAVQADAGAAVPQSHRALLENMPYVHETEDLICVHAGIRPGIPLDRQDPDDLVWIRFEFLESTRDHGRLVVHGHTPAEAPENHGNRINLDTGAGYGRPLTAAVFEGREPFILTDNGRTRLPLIWDL
ncbi:metallophosphoesterase family protein [Psychromarinibacter sp. C21-152]|uniref:Metallophosphoesterase family protein n=1 Tax=Psychromarinibacter sediminicola TaxID=3033385 RepID=A0AAE3NVC2_9RHOB|nr:metallophosphoesterase family protein [Psychromarinibacter sediminicola]MDF0601307.1 metallophosphoesterase family protein [Psychromarinibacter sediminicola]